MRAPVVLEVAAGVKTAVGVAAAGVLSGAAAVGLAGTGVSGEEVSSGAGVCSTHAVKASSIRIIAITTGTLITYASRDIGV